MTLAQKLLADPKVRAVLDRERERNDAEVGRSRTEMAAFSHSAKHLATRLENSLTPENVWRRPR